MLTNNNITVMLVDDHPLFRRGLREVITHKTPYTVTAEAEDAATAITLAKIHKPTVIVTDLALPDHNGLHVIKELTRLKSKTQFVVMTLYNDIALVEEALNLGVSAYLMKSDGVDIFEDCLLNLSKQEIYVSPSVSAPPPRLPIASADDIQWQEILSNREQTVLKGIACNQTSREIAETMKLSIRTVQNHRARIIRKLGLEGSNALYRFALEHVDHINLL